ncbi:NADH-quinone oxidoreductase subunit N [bacterium]|nr:NADH-quinone oxidoreductase subunit N [bacterium]
MTDSFGIGPMTFSLFDIIALSPVLVLVITSFLILLTSVDSKRRCSPAAIKTVSILALFISMEISMILWVFAGPSDLWRGMLVLDNLSLIFNMIITAAALLTIFISSTYEKAVNFPLAEYYFMMLSTTSGMMLMASGTNLLLILIALELFSISLYVLVGLLREDKISREASLKYFFMGAFATGFLFYGIALVYGAAGSLNLDKIFFAAKGANPEQQLFFAFGFGLMLVGFAFKIGLVPFHKWVPDVYEGAPTSVTAFMSVGTKAAAFAALLRVAVYAMPEFRAKSVYIIWIIAIATMLYGNITALYQRNIKRLLAYSSIAQAGYILIPFVSANHLSVSGIVFYLSVYTFANIGAFGVVMVMGSDKDEHLDINDYKGIGYQHPALALCMSIFLLSLAGFPPTAGFIGKFFLFASAVEEGFYVLASIGILTSVISVFYYIRIIVNMYMHKEEKTIPKRRISGFTKAIIILSAIIVLLIGILPSPLFDIAKQTISSIFPDIPLF